MATKSRLDHFLDRIDPTRLSVKNPFGIPIDLFANEEVPIEIEAVEEILRFAEISETCEKTWGAEPSFWGEISGKLNRIVLTPDFHKGSGMPIGTVAETTGFIIPQAPGSDIGCGMRLLVTDITRDQIEPHLKELMPVLRAIFFQGKREVIMSPNQREALLRDGLWGLLETQKDNAGKGIWRHYDPQIQSEDLMRVHFQGVLPAKDIFAFGDYIRQSGTNDSRDSQLGSVGGSNHFCEIQTVEDVLEGSTAHEWGLKKNLVTIMVHTGSVALGHTVGDFFKDEAIKAYPKSLKRPNNDFFLIPTHGPHEKLAARYLDAMNNAANFAFGNRLFLGMMALRGISEVLGREVSSRLVYDAPHNLIWASERGKGIHVHRKGACPSPGMSAKFPSGTAVIIPGSMCSASYVLAGKGNEASLSSACHGAGRAISRGKAREHSNLNEISKLHVVTPIDPESAMVRNRADILKEYTDRLMEEKGSSYKSITPIIDSIRDAKIASPVVRLWPLLTIKG